MADNSKGPRITTQTASDLQAPSVSFAPVAPSESAGEAFTKEFLPSVVKALTPSKIENDGRDITLSTIQGFETDVQRLNEEGNLDQSSLQALTSRYQSTLVKGLLSKNVDPKFYSNAREQFKFATENNQFFQVEKDGDITTSVNMFSGKSSTKFNSLQKVQADLQQAILGRVPASILTKAQDVGDINPRYIAQATKEQEEAIAIKNDLALKTAANDLRGEEKEELQTATTGIFNRQINNTLGSMNTFKDTLVEDMTNGKLSPGEAEASMDEWFNTMRQDTELNESLIGMGRDPQEFFKEMDTLKKDMVAIVKSRDPQKELTREVMGKELALRNLKSDVMLNMPEKARNRLLISANIQNLVMSQHYMKSSFARDIPAIEYLNLIQNDEFVVRERFAPVWSSASDEDPGGAELPNTNAATQIVLNSLFHITNGDLSNPESASVENTLVMFEKLKQLDTYDSIPLKVKQELDRRAQSLYSTFEGDKDVLRVLRKYVDENKDSKSFFGSFFGTNEVAP